MKRLLPICFFAAITLTMFAGLTENAYSQGTSTLIHYWNFNNLAGPYTHPNIPPIPADYTVLTPVDSAYLEYYLLPGTSAAWAITGVDANNASGAQIDNVASTDTTNLRQGAVSGLALRCRNPLDSAELHWHIPSTGFTNLVVTFATESSSIASGDSAQIYSYSVDGGKAWDSTGMTVNGAPGNTLDLTQGGNANSLYLGFGLVTITFGSNTAVNNNPNLIFRIVFRGNTHPNTPVSGNNRFDDFTLDGVGSSGPAPASITMTSPKAGNIFVPGRQMNISFTTYSEVEQARTIQFSPDSVNWTDVTTLTGTTSYNWTIPTATAATTNGYIRVMATDSSDASNITAMAGPIIIYPVTAANRLVHYWNFNSLNASYYTPNVPNLPADFSASESNQGYIQYVNFAQTPKYSYIDNVAGTDTNARLGSPAGSALRVRNPSDSMELHLVIPTNGYTGISISYALQASSLSGANVQHFAYSIDGGQTYIAKGITVNGVKQDSLDVTQVQYQSATLYGGVTISFDTVTAMDNIPGFIFRIIFGNDSAKNLSGNNRFDNISVDAKGIVAPASVNEPAQVQQQLNLTPNPATDYVSFENPFTSLANVSVVDMLGREVIHSEAAASSNVEINTSNLTGGSYYIHIQNVSNGAEQLSKFVKE